MTTANSLTEEQILKSIQAKSDQLNAVDLVAGPIDVTIEGASYGTAEQPFVLKISGGYQPYKPNVTFRRVIVQIWGTDQKKWIGKRLRLFNNPDVTWGSEAVGGIEISHMSGIDKPATLSLNKSRGKKRTITINPIPELDVETRVVQCIGAIRNCKSKDDVDKLMKRAEALVAIATDEQRLRIEAARNEVLESVKH